MQALERTRRVLNRLSEPLRQDEPVPPPTPDDDESEPVAACADPDDPANT